MRTMTWKMVSGCLVLVNSKEHPLPEEWNSYLKFISENRPESLIVLSRGGAPNAGQRQALEQTMGSKNLVIKTSVLTTDAFARGVVTAFGWWHKKIKAFHPDDLEAALAFADVSKLLLENIKSTLVQLESEI